ncbi:teleost multiple tissue opsin b isoform X3 [Fundulus heteroclitus]|uniref:teleost multiple tissue opsin b isoform X3 n=1 Tax=Fundulus heteroclitus TaxID=8078 RepID=UPI00165B8047|nr:teleost multiple tissue opsin b isoform X3 [Fundulus heteroclitus]
MIVSNASLSCARCPGEATTEADGGVSGSLSARTLSPTGHLVVAVCLGCIGTLGFLSNFLVLALFCRYRALRTPMNLLLVSISVSDLLVSVLGTPFSFAASTQGRWLIGRAGCVWYGFINACLGAQSELSGDPSQRAARAGDGHHHGGLLPGLLAALRGGGSARHLRPQRPPDAGGKHHAVAAGQVFHCCQPFYIHIHEQTVSQMFPGVLLLLRSRARLHLKDIFSTDEDVSHPPPAEGPPGDRPRSVNGRAHAQLRARLLAGGQARGEQRLLCCRSRGRCGPQTQTGPGGSLQGIKRKSNRSPSFTKERQNKGSRSPHKTKHLN